MQETTFLRQQEREKRSVRVSSYFCLHHSSCSSHLELWLKNLQWLLLSSSQISHSPSKRCSSCRINLFSSWDWNRMDDGTGCSEWTGIHFSRESKQKKRKSFLVRVSLTDSSPLVTHLGIRDFDSDCYDCPYSCRNPCHSILLHTLLGVIHTHADCSVHPCMLIPIRDKSPWRNRQKVSDMGLKSFSLLILKKEGDSDLMRWLLFPNHGHHWCKGRHKEIMNEEGGRRRQTL